MAGEVSSRRYAPPHMPPTPENMSPVEKLVVSIGPENDPLILLTRSSRVSTSSPAHSGIIEQEGKKAVSENDDMYLSSHPEISRTDMPLSGSAPPVPSS